MMVSTRRTQRAALTDDASFRGAPAFMADGPSFLRDTGIVTNELLAILDGLSHIVFTVKDTSGKYKHVNMTLAHRLGFKHREDVIGRTPVEVYPSSMGELFMQQDQRVLRGDIIENALEPQFFPVRTPGWCLTHKRPLIEDGAVRGIVSFSRDLGRQPSQQSIFTRLSFVADSIQTRYTENLRVQSLAQTVDMSLVQLERHFKRVFDITPQQMLTKMRITLALKLLEGDDSLSRIAQTCGFTDQSSFTRKFKDVVGTTPRRYRDTMLVPSLVTPANAE